MRRFLKTERGKEEIKRLKENSYTLCTLCCGQGHILGSLVACLSEQLAFMNQSSFMILFYSKESNYNIM